MDYQKIKTLVAKGDKASAQAEQFYKAAGTELLAGQKDFQTRADWLAAAEKKCGLKQSRIYQLVRLARGKVTLEEIHESNRERQKAHRARRRVGITLERKDRSKMQSVEFLIKKEIHAVMRQAAFDHHITMQELLRRGLELWLTSHDYEFPDDAVASTRPENRLHH